MKPEGAAPSETLQPFALRHTSDLPDLLGALRASLLISTYQAGKVVALSAEGDRLVQLPRTFQTPMGLAVDGDRLAVATQNEIVLLANDARLTAEYPKQPGRYDAMFVPRSVHFSGALAVHDLAWTDAGLVGVNTVFSCLFRLDEKFSFAPTWKPPFVTALAPEDRCHLNGLAIEDGKPRYVTALGASDSSGGWRDGIRQGGILIDLASGETALGGLAMPHTPRIYDGQLYALLSATGEVVAIDPAAGRYEVVRKVGGFVRGMAKIGEHLFVASSRLREGHVFEDLRSGSERSDFCGITVLHLPTGAYVGELEYLRTCEEIYDVQALPGCLRPNILGTVDETHRRALSTPERTYWAAEQQSASRRQAN